jgi:hypothetical protein
MASTSVNRPTNPKQKEQDINQKLQLYGIFTAFSNGKVPSVSYCPIYITCCDLFGLLTIKTTERANRCRSEQLRQTIMDDQPIQEALARGPGPRPRLQRGR